MMRGKVVGAHGTSWRGARVLQAPTRVQGASGRTGLTTEQEENEGGPAIKLVEPVLPLAASCSNETLPTAYFLFPQFSF